jgi:hypothetical protein
MNYERHTKAQIDPPLPSEKLYRCLLDPSEFEACHREMQIMLIKGHVVQSESAVAYEDIKSCLRPECLTNGDVVFQGSKHFSAARACKAVEHKFGLSGLRTYGSRNRVTAVLVSSFVTYVSPDVHVKRYANILRAIKSRYSNVHFGEPDCQLTTACDPRLNKLLADLMSEDDLIKRNLEE